MLMLVFVHELSDPVVVADIVLLIGVLGLATLVRSADLRTQKDPARTGPAGQVGELAGRVSPGVGSPVAVSPASSAAIPAAYLKVPAVRAATPRGSGDDPAPRSHARLVDWHARHGAVSR